MGRMPVSLIRAAADRAQQLLGRSRLMVRFAVLVRNQARCVIKYHLAEGPNVADTGEGWLRDAVAKQGANFIDVGANVGDWLAGIAAVKDGAPFQAIAFEPSHSALERLRLRFNRDARIALVEAAAGDEPGELTFVEENDAGKGSTLVPGLGRINGARRTVRVTTVDAELARAGWKTVDFLKIDAEGFDARVIRGSLGALRDQRVGVVQFEYNRAWQMAGETLRGCYRMLEDCGYQVFLLKRDGLFELNYALYEEYYEYSNFAAFSPEVLPKFASFVRGTI